jgi:hypothetical protein
MRLSTLSTFCCLSLLSSPAWATIDTVISTTIVYQHPQVEGHCYQQVPVAASIGIPAAVQIDAALSPHYAYTNNTGSNTQLIGGLHYQNLNAIAVGPRIKHTYILDSYLASGTFEYRAELDVTDLATANGSSIDGRARTVLQAKLALLAAARVVASNSTTGSYRLFLTFKGLPSQTGLPGTALPASTKWPYSSGSPVLAALQKELISAQCPAGGKADELGTSSTPVEEGAGGCSVVSTRSRACAAIALLASALLGAGLALRRRRR